MVCETGVQFQVESYQRFKKWYLMPPYLALVTIKKESKVKWSNPGNGVAPSPIPRCTVTIEKGAIETSSAKVVNFTYCSLLVLLFDFFSLSIQLSILTNNPRLSICLSLFHAHDYLTILLSKILITLSLSLSVSHDNLLCFLYMNSSLTVLIPLYPHYT